MMVYFLLNIQLILSNWVLYYLKKKGYLILFIIYCSFFQELSFLSKGLSQINTFSHAYLEISALEYYILLGNLGGLSLTSVRVMFTVVVPASPPSCPPMSLAWIRTWYCSFTSLSIFGKAVLITPMRRNGKEKEQINKGLWLSTLAIYYWISWTRNRILKRLMRGGCTETRKSLRLFKSVFIRYSTTQNECFVFSIRTWMDEREWCIFTRDINAVIIVLPHQGWGTLLCTEWENVGRGGIA